jgi:hypothetical protein
MIKILDVVRMAWPSVRTVNCNRLSKIALKTSITTPRPNGVSLASGQLYFCCTTCLTKDSVRMGTPHCADGLQLSSHICVWDRNPITCRTLNGILTVLPRRSDECTWTLDSSWTLNNGGTICHYFRTDAILNSLKFLDTVGRLDGKFSLSGRMMLWQMSVWMEYYVVRTDLADWWASGWNTTSSGRKLGIRLLWVGICTESSLNTEIAFLKLVTRATCHNEALSISEKQTLNILKTLN